MSKLILVSLTLLWCLGVAVHGFTYDEKEIKTEQGKLAMFERWRSHHKMEKISEKEKTVQYNNFKATLEHVHNTNKANKSFKLEMNRFAGMNKAEFKSKFTGLRAAPPRIRPGKKIAIDHGGPFRYANFTNIPPSIDWRALGAVTPVKNQDQCASCYSFAAVDAVEGMHFIRNKELIALSPKEIVDCAQYDPPMGCVGGFVTISFEYIEKNGGLTTEKNYPYKPQVDPCNVKKEHDIAVQVGGHEIAPMNDEALTKALANQPVAASIKMEDDFMFYKEGVLSSPCGTAIDHAVLLVGYDTAPDGTKYWIGKNSWGDTWGEKGYFKILRGVPEPEGYCGVNIYICYPTPDKTSTPHIDGEPMVHLSRDL
ncbi:hypothetical protein LXL04_031915 [Taraxacum kok-saghyz]